MRELSRRQFLATSAKAGASLAAFAALGACGGTSKSGASQTPRTSGSGATSASGSKPPAGTTEWWESGQPTLALDKQLIAAHAESLGDVKATFYALTTFAQAIQLAHQSHKMPDLTFYDPSIGSTVAQLVADGWFQPLELDAAATKRVASMNLLEGVHVFSGKVYTFPNSAPGTNTVNWYHLDAVQKAGADPSKPPTTYDGFRALCKKVNGGGRSAMILPMKITGRNGSQADFYAQAAGFPGQSGQLFKTDEYAYDSDEYVNYIEFLRALDADGLLVKGGVSLDVKTAQGQWAAGRAVFYWDGPWIPGNIKTSYPEIAGQVGGGPTLVPNGDQTPVYYMPPAGGCYYIPADAQHAEVANRIMSLISADEYQAAFCNIMGKLPIDAASIAKSSATPLWKSVATGMMKSSFTAPDPLVRNPDIAKVQPVPVKPDLGTLIQGVFSGDVKDVKGSLKALSDASNKALEAALTKAKSAGAKVSIDDYAFPNWKPGADYTSEMYKS